MSNKTERSPSAAAAHIPYFSAFARWIYRNKIVLLDSGSTSGMAKSKALQSNLDVDYVISYKFDKLGMFAFVKSMDVLLNGLQIKPKLPPNSRSSVKLSQMLACRPKSATETRPLCFCLSG
jgi:hypothetical protein